MDLKQIRTFIYVANLRSFSKAARALNVAQPAVSRHVQSLESDLRTQLLFRTARGVVLTEAGATLVTMGENLLSEAERVREAVMRAPEKATGQVVVGLPPSLSPILAAFLVDECRRLAPDVTLHIMEGLSIFLEEWLSLGRIDMAVLTDLGEHPTLNRKLLVSEEMVLVGEASAIKALPDPVSVDQIASLQLVITHGFRGVIDRLVREAGLQLTYALELDSIGLIKEMLSRGTFATILPYALVRQESFAGKVDVRSIRDPKLVRNLVIATNSKRPVTSAMKTVRTIVTQQARDIPFASA